MKFSLMTASALTAAFCASALAEDKRAADAHQHGHGVLNAALEGKTLGIELETPGMDILGFEHAAESAKDKETVHKARDILADPVALFGLSDAAGCSVTETEIEIGADETSHEEGDDPDHGHEEHDDHAKKDSDDHHDHDDHADEKESHSEVHAHYTLTCTAPAQISGLNLSAFFAAFPNAEELDAAILTDSGQASGEITPRSPAVTF